MTAGTPDTGDFWARRKAAVRAEDLAEKQAAEAEALKATQKTLEERTDSEILEELDLPDPDQLQPGDDISGFMAQVVPDRLRRRALRQLWRLNPALANLDGLVDYGEDFSDPSYLLGEMQTAYQVGKGMLAHIEEMARQAEADGTDKTGGPDHSQAEDPDDIASVPDDTSDGFGPPCGTTSPPDEIEPEGISPFPAPKADDTDVIATAAAVAPHVPAPARPRRMQFRFEG